MQCGGGNPSTISMVFPVYITFLSFLKGCVAPVPYFSSLLVAEGQKWHHLPLSPLPITGHVSSFRLHTCCSRFGVRVLLGCPGELHEPEECICCGSDGKGRHRSPKPQVVWQNLKGLDGSMLGLSTGSKEQRHAGAPGTGLSGYPQPSKQQTAGI